MVRPCKPRFVSSEPCVCMFKPQGVPSHALEHEHLSVEELEALRLSDLEDLYQEDAAERMEVSRATFQRTLKSAREKVTRCLVEGKALGIEGGNYVLGGKTRTFVCGSCGHRWDAPFGSGARACHARCPECGGATISRYCAGHGRGMRGETGETSCGSSMGTQNHRRHPGASSCGHHPGECQGEE